MAAHATSTNRLRGPLGFAGLGVAVVATVVGYVFTLLGVTLRFNQDGLGSALSNTEAYVVIATGLALFVVAYAGWKAFLTYSY